MELKAAAAVTDTELKAAAAVTDTAAAAADAGRPNFGPSGPAGLISPA